MLNKSTNNVTTMKGEDFFFIKEKSVHPKKREREEREKAWFVEYFMTFWRKKVKILRLIKELHQPEVMQLLIANKGLGIFSLSWKILVCKGVEKICLWTSRFIFLKHRANGYAHDVIWNKRSQFLIGSLV